MFDSHRIDHGDIGPDDTVFLQPPDPPLNGGRRQVDGFADRPLRCGIVALQDLEDLAVEEPGLNLDFSFTDRQVDLVEEGIDLVVRLIEPGDRASLVGRRIGTQRLIIRAAPAYLDHRRRPSSVEELVDHDCLAFAKDGSPLPWAVRGGSGQGVRYPTAPHDQPWRGLAGRYPG